LAAQTNAFTSFFRYNSDSSLQPNEISIIYDLKLIE